jgi:integrase
VAEGGDGTSATVAHHLAASCPLLNLRCVGPERHAARPDPVRGALEGASFHTLRHTAASLLAELGDPEAIRKQVMGHHNIATTQRYTHLRQVHEIPAHERLAGAVPDRRPAWPH